MTEAFGRERVGDVLAFVAAGSAVNDEDRILHRDIDGDKSRVVDFEVVPFERDGQAMMPRAVE